MASMLLPLCLFLLLPTSSPFAPFLATRAQNVNVKKAFHQVTRLPLLSGSSGSTATTTATTVRTTSRTTTSLLSIISEYDREDEDEEEDDEDGPKKKKKRKARSKKTATMKQGSGSEWFEDLRVVQENATSAPAQTLELPERFVQDPTKDMAYISAYLDEDLVDPSENLLTYDIMMRRNANHVDHVSWARSLTRDNSSGIFVEHSLALLSDDLEREAGSVMAIKVEQGRMSDSVKPAAGTTDLDVVYEAIANDPVFKQLRGTNFGEPVTSETVKLARKSGKMKLFRWRKVEGDPLLKVDDGIIVNATEAMNPEMDFRLTPGTMDFNKYNNEAEEALQKAFPTLVILEDKADMGSLRADTREEHLEYLRQSGRVIAAGPLFSADVDDEPPVGSMVLFNSLEQEDAIEFVKNDPYAKAGLFKDAFLSRYNLVDVTGKFCAVNKVERLEQAFDKIEYELGVVGGEGKEGTFAFDNTPWANR